ncbi:3-oxo-tetronate kinase [Agromyces aerolatus]|uniref:3-oxo-tetronate kinase n=1 Tax=Agromyces sp. LY-1074 TaxID=3074080 RepID=UPI0028671B24|nr:MULTISPECIES: 3-oxo-tetronate kinase [unclassified Agromyces]MDR5699389.1 four-carbon acid sugar kinase family protein [Agromyces sp. LY-1074]MDR5705685.1 four-carbon acid sugar kinase family protein [Agromyces sp. LY-1358]
MLGAIADDVTGAVDLAANLVSRGFRTRLHVGVPSGPLDGADDADAVVVALKTRTAPVEQALAESGASLDALRTAGADRFYVKYCSTFDSTPKGNIGPVCDLVVDRLGATTTVVVPSFPDNGRTLYLGHLFVGDVLLSESSLATHPLTPMTDPDLVRVLQQQTPSRVALIPLPTVRRGAPAVQAALAELGGRGVRYAVVDAIDDHDLGIIAEATAEASVITGGSGLALGMTGPTDRGATPAPEALRTGPGVVLAGSASAATRTQLAHAVAAGLPVHRLDVDALDASVERAFDWASGCLAHDPASTPVIAPEETGGRVDATTESGSARAAALEAAFGELARRFADAGIRRFIIAGGETSGAVVNALGVGELAVGEPISPGLAWTFGTARTSGGPATIALALKSGNFGHDDVFLDAWRRLA